jgi:hypothetical protein
MNWEGTYYFCSVDINNEDLDNNRLPRSAGRVCRNNKEINKGIESIVRWTGKIHINGRQG